MFKCLLTSLLPDIIRPNINDLTIPIFLLDFFQNIFKTCIFSRIWIWIHHLFGIFVLYLSFCCLRLEINLDLSQSFMAIKHWSLCVYDTPTVTWDICFLEDIQMIYSWEFSKDTDRHVTAGIYPLPKRLFSELTLVGIRYHFRNFTRDNIDSSQ